ncbi:MAG: hypothetical protein CTY25_03880 [Methylobacterium sp.]|nr:MAG: hypothetical protein CTY25_03880 [Methylobacterium sp.]
MATTVIFAADHLRAGTLHVDFINPKFADGADTSGKRGDTMVDVFSTSWQELLSARVEYLVGQKLKLSQELRIVEKELRSIKKIAKVPSTKPRIRARVNDPMLDKIVEVLGDGVSRKRVNLIEELTRSGFPDVSGDVTALTRLLKKAVAAGQIAMQGRYYSLPKIEAARTEAVEPTRRAS